MKPVLSAEEMRAVDALTQESISLEQLISRAGFAVASQALSMLGGGYGKRIIVVAGKGHNGDDGRVAASVLSRRGAHVEVFDESEVPDELAACDLVIDAVFGTGFHGEYRAPRLQSGTRVLSVDIPSGLDANIGVASEGAFSAEVTITFGALKPGLLLGDGPLHCGRIVVADIGLPVESSMITLVEEADLDRVPPRRRDGHKWDHTVFVLAGSPGMMGAAALVTTAAMRAGAGMVRLGSPGADPEDLPATDAVTLALPKSEFAPVIMKQLARFKSMVIGPGLGTRKGTAQAIRDLISQSTVPTVIDADGLNALAAVSDWPEITTASVVPLILTPHEGEFERLIGEGVGSNRVVAARHLAAKSGATVLLKGSPTIVVSTEAKVAIVNSGSPRLSTAGSGDVLSGIIGALCARGLDPFDATMIGAYVHGRAAALSPTDGLVASDLPLLVAHVLDRHSSHRGRWHRRRRSR